MKLKKIENTELILLKDKNIEYCKGCLTCRKKNQCIVKDDMNQIIEKMLSYDFIIFGIPNYFDNVSGLFKNFMDQLHPLYKSEMLNGKKVIFIYIGGGNEKRTKIELHHSIYGLIKYLKINVIKEYSFKSLLYNVVQKQSEKINKIVNEIII